jgi:hypothetical protein
MTRANAVARRRRAAHVVAAVLLTAAPAALACDPAIDPLGPRAKVYLFDYGGAESDDARDRHSQFQAAMLDKAERWGEELSRLGVDADYLEQLQVIKAGKDALAGKPALVGRYWKDSHALQLMSGIVDGASGQYSVRSRMYLGELRGGLESSSLLVGMPITASQFGNVMDSHSIVTFYALAVDAERRHCDRAVAIALLNSLNEKVSDLKRRGGPLDPGVELVATAARARLDELARRP